MTFPKTHSVGRERISTVQMLLMVLFTIAMVLSNILAAKQIAYPFGFNGAGGILVFPITYILSDVFSEVYGYKWSRRQAWIGFGANLFAVIAFQVVLALPHPVWWEGQEALTTALGTSWRFLVAGLVAYMLGDFVNDKVFKHMRGEKKVGEKFFRRAILSSFIGELFDSTIFTIGAFIGVMDWPTLGKMIVVGCLTKTAYEVIIAPVTLKIVKELKKYESASN